MSDDLVRQPALRRWQESVYGNGPYQVPDYESMAAIVQEHEQMAVRIEELEAKLAKAVEIMEREIRRVQKIQRDLPPPHNVGLIYVEEEYKLILSELKGETDE